MSGELFEAIGAVVCRLLRRSPPRPAISLKIGEQKVSGPVMQQGQGNTLGSSIRIGPDITDR